MSRAHLLEHNATNSRIIVSNPRKHVEGQQSTCLKKIKIKSTFHISFKPYTDTANYDNIRRTNKTEGHKSRRHTVFVFQSVLKISTVKMNVTFIHS